MKTFLIGLGVGIGLGVLFAPMSGEETRNRLSDRANDLADSARDTMEQGRNQMQRGVSAIRSATDRMTGSGTSNQMPTGTQGSNI